MLALEAFYYDGVRPAQCIEICERGIALLTQLLQEAKTYSCAMEIPDNWIEVRRRRLEATCERNRTLFLTEE